MQYLSIFLVVSVCQFYTSNVDIVSFLGTVEKDILPYAFFIIFHKSTVVILIKVIVLIFIYYVYINIILGHITEGRTENAISKYFFPGLTPTMIWFS
jgi:hypothetical protein